jgi:hypothetical protein
VLLSLSFASQFGDIVFSYTVAADQYLLHLILFAFLVSASSCIAKLLEATLPPELC